MLGLSQKGHLGVGADADIAVYRVDDNKETMFAVPRYVIKSGQILVEDFEIRNVVHGKTLTTHREFDVAAQGEIEAWFSQQYSVAPESYGVEKGEFANRLNS